MLQSIRIKLILSMIFTSLMVSLIVLVVTPFMVKHEILEHSVDQYVDTYRKAIEHYIEEYQKWGTREAAIAFASSADLLLVEQVTEIATMPVDFTLVDQNGHVLRQTSQYQLGESVDAAVLKSADAIYMKGQIVAYVAVSGELPLSPWESAYLHTLRESLMFSVFIAVLALLPFEIWRGNRLVSTIRLINVAVKKMGKGELEQQVAVTSKDEIGQLASAFNSMNTRLVEAYNELTESNKLIERQAAQLKELSIRDELTGLFNRRYFKDEIEVLLASAKRHSEPLAFVVGDVDFFKKINDGYSHAIGDEVLKRVANILSCQVRSVDLLARYGGEEMIFALPKTNLDEAMTQVERMREAIEQFAWREIVDGLQVTMSFGIALLQPEMEYPQLFEAADSQLYRAKSEGRNRVCAAP